MKVARNCSINASFVNLRCGTSSIDQSIDVFKTGFGGLSQKGKRKGTRWIGKGIESADYGKFRY